MTADLHLVNVSGTVGNYQLSGLHAISLTVLLVRSGLVYIPVLGNDLGAIKTF